MPDEDDEFEATKQWLDVDMATLRARAHDDTASPAERRRAIQALLSFQRQVNQMARRRIDALVHDAYGVGDVDATWRSAAASLLIEYGLVTQFDLDHRPMDEVLADVRQHFVERGIMDDTGLAT